MKKKYYFSVIIGFFLILGLSTVSAQEQHNETDEDNNGWSDETCLDYPELCNGDPVDLEEIIVTEDCYTCACDPFWCDPEPDPQPCSTCECDEFYCDPDPMTIVEYVTEIMIAKQKKLVIKHVTLLLKF